MSTKWYPLPRPKPRSWLLGDGTVVTEPVLEQSTSGLKVRVPGTGTSAYAKDMDSMILTAVQATAKAKNTYVWMALGEVNTKMRAMAGIEPGVRNNDLYLLRAGIGDERGQTHLWWRFRHDTMPVDAYLVLTAYSAGSRSTKHESQVRVIVPDTRIATPTRLDNEPLTENAPEWYSWYYRMGGPEDSVWRNFVDTRGNRPDWSEDLLGSTVVINERQMVQTLLKQVDAIEALDTITIPDLRDVMNPTWMELRVAESNFPGSFRAALTDYLAGATGVGEAIRLYDEFRQAMGTLGITLSPLADNDLQRALEQGEESPLCITIEPVAGENEAGFEHTLGVHLLSGTFTVTCPVRHATQNEIATEWEKARIVAQLKGEEDALLAYAREFGRTHDEKRARQVMRERMKGVQNGDD